MKAAKSLVSRGSKLLAGDASFRANGAAEHQVPAARRRFLHVQAAVKEVFMPALSSTMMEGKIVSWLKSEGDEIKKGEAIVVVESDKADMDVESFNDGILGSIVVPEGGVANVGTAIAFIAEQEGDLTEAKEKGGGGNTASSVAVEAAPPSPPASKPEDNAAPESNASPPPIPAPAVPVVSSPMARTDGRIVATPHAKKLAKQLGVDLATVAGSGPAGRVTAEDVEALTSNGAKASAPAAPTAPSPAGATTGGAPAPAPAPPAVTSTKVSKLRGTTEPLSTLQLSVAQNMIDSMQVPQFRVSMAITTDSLEALYNTSKPHGVTMTTLLAKACGIALAQHPLLFSSCTPDGKGITYNEHVNVAVAVAMPDGGLITPVLTDCDKTDIYTISRAWHDLVKRSRAKKLAPVEYNSGTFTLSNLGMFGVESFDPILPFGSSAILGIAGSKPCVVATDDGMICVQKQMNVSLACDHRVVYGAHAAEFLQTLKATIESPEKLTL